MGAVVSHVSAAAMYGLPSWRVPLNRVHVSRDRDHGGRIDRVLHVHAARIGADEIGLLGGVAVTSAARTVADCARTSPFEQSVVIADAALHTGSSSRPSSWLSVRRAGTAWEVSAA